MLDYISYGPPTAVPPGISAGQNTAALAGDLANGALYINNSSGVWKPIGGGLVASASLTGQTSASNAVTLYTPTVSTSGIYSLDFYTKLTTTGTSPVLGPLTITYKDAVDNVSMSVVASGQTQAGAQATSLTATTTGQVFCGDVLINAGSAAAIVATLTVSGTIGAAIYEFYMRLEYLG